MGRRRARRVHRSALPWNVQPARCASRVLVLTVAAQRRGAAAAVDEELDSFMHLWALNRGILLTPFHNMALMSPHHSVADVSAHDAVFASAVEALIA